MWEAPLSLGLIPAWWVEVILHVEGGEEVDHRNAVEDAPHTKVVVQEPDEGLNKVNEELDNL